MLIIDIFGQLRNSLRIRLRLKLEPLARQQLLQLFVICDDAIVHDGELPARVAAVGMAVEAGRRAVGGPASVCDAAVMVEDLAEIWLLLLDELFELGDLAYFLEGEDLVLLVAVDCEAGGVVAAVFEAGEAFTYRDSGQRTACADSTGKASRTINECVEDVLPVLLHQVVDVSEDTAVPY